jgi:hypothetical protein
MRSSHTLAEGHETIAVIPRQFLVQISLACRIRRECRRSLSDVFRPDLIQFKSGIATLKVLMKKLVTRAGSSTAGEEFCEVWFPGF